MSKLIKRNDYSRMVELWYTDDEKIGTFQTLFCETHGNGWSFTDKSGADNCIECIKDMVEPKSEYPLPGFEDLPEKLSKLTIRKPSIPDSSEKGGYDGCKNLDLVTDWIN